MSILGQLLNNHGLSYTLVGKAAGLSTATVVRAADKRIRVSGATAKVLAELLELPAEALFEEGRINWDSRSGRPTGPGGNSSPDPEARRIVKERLAGVYPSGMSRLERLCAEAGLNMEELAKRAGVGPNLVYRVNSSEPVRRGSLEKLAAVFEQSVEEVFGVDVPTLGDERAIARYSLSPKPITDQGPRTIVEVLRRKSGMSIAQFAAATGLRSRQVEAIEAGGVLNSKAIRTLVAYFKRDEADLFEPAKPGAKRKHAVIAGRL